MKKSLFSLSIASAALLCSSLSFAYQLEVGGSIGRVDYDIDDDTVINFHGRYFLEDVFGGAGPLKEEAFLSQTSWIQADFEDYGDGEALSVEGRYMFDEAEQLFAVAEIVSADDESFQPDVIRGGVGKYLTEQSDVIASLARVDYLDEDGLLISGQYHQLLNLASGNDIGIDARAALGEYTLIGGGATFYLSGILSVGVALDLIDHDDADRTDFTLRADYFYTDTIQTFAEYKTMEYDFDFGGDLDIDVIQFGVYVRM